MPFFFRWLQLWRSWFFVCQCTISKRIVSFGITHIAKLNAGTLSFFLSVKRPGINPQYTFPTPQKHIVPQGLTAVQDDDNKYVRIPVNTLQKYVDNNKELLEMVDVYKGREARMAKRFIRPKTSDKEEIVISDSEVDIKVSWTSHTINDHCGEFYVLQHFRLLKQKEHQYI